MNQTIFRLGGFMARGLFAVLLLAPAFALAQSAAIVVNHSDSPDPEPAGGTFTYTVRVEINGPGNAANVRIADTLPPGSTFVSATVTAGAGSCTPPASGVVNCAFGAIPFTLPTTTVSIVDVKVIPA